MILLLLIVCLVEFIDQGFPVLFWNEVVLLTKQSLVDCQDFDSLAKLLLRIALGKLLKHLLRVLILLFKLLDQILALLVLDFNFACCCHLSMNLF